MVILSSQPIGLKISLWIVKYVTLFLSLIHNLRIVGQNVKHRHITEIGLAMLFHSFLVCVSHLSQISIKSDFFLILLFISLNLGFFHVHISFQTVTRLCSYNNTIFNILHIKTKQICVSVTFYIAQFTCIFC